MIPLEGGMNEKGGRWFFWVAEESGAAATWKRELPLTGFSIVERV